MSITSNKDFPYTVTLLEGEVIKLCKQYNTLSQGENVVYVVEETYMLWNEEKITEIQKAFIKSKEAYKYAEEYSKWIKKYPLSHILSAKLKEEIIYKGKEEEKVLSQYKVSKETYYLDKKLRNQKLIEVNVIEVNLY